MQVAYPVTPPHWFSRAPSGPDFAEGGRPVANSAAGAVFGKARQVHHKQEIANRLAETIEPDQSGLIALVTDPRVERFQKALDKADRIVSEAIDQAAADELRAATNELDS